MYSTRNHIYRAIGHVIQKIDIKYKTIKYIPFPSYGIVKHVKENILSNGNHTCILFKDRDPQFFDLNAPYDITVLNRNIIICQYARFRDRNIIIYNLENKTTKIINRNNYENILESPPNNHGDTKILIKRGFIVAICNDIDQCFGIPNKQKVLEYWRSDIVYKWISSDEIVEIVYNAWEYYSEVCFLDLNFKLMMLIYISNYKLDANINNVATGNGILYLWYGKRILVVNKMGAVEINHHCDIEVYNQHYDMFVDSNMNLYKIHGNKLIKFHFEYDIWYDIDKPEQIHNIITTMMELQIFPNEIYNVVYQCLSQ